MSEKRRRGDIGLIGALLGAGAAVRHSLRTRGVHNTAIFAAFGLAFPALGEYIAVNWTKVVHHRQHPQVKGIPVGVLLAGTP